MVGSNIYLFGIHTPLIVDYEETATRLKLNAIPVLIDELESRCAILESAITAEDTKAATSYIPCAFMPPRRAEIVSIASAYQLKPASALLDPSSVVASTSELAEGCYCNAGVAIGGLTNIGEHTVINRGTSIGHHVLIDDFVSLGPSVTLSGGVMIGAGSMIGGGSVILPGVSIGENSIVAAGSVVKDNVPDNTMVAGVPARVKKTGDVYSGVYIRGEE